MHIMNGQNDKQLKTSKINFSRQGDLMNFSLAKLDGVKTYMRIRKVPGNIQNKVIKWFDYLWLTQKSSDEEKAINCLPGRG